MLQGRHRWVGILWVALALSGCGDESPSTSDAGADAVVADGADATGADLGVALDVSADRNETSVDGASDATTNADASDAEDASEVGDAVDASDVEDATDADAGAVLVDLPVVTDVGFDTGSRDVAVVDVGFDSGPRDTGNDVGFDTGPRDTGNDTGPRDTGNDVGFDTGPRDTGNDTGNDTGPRDTGNDVGFDAGPRDTGNDVGFDTGPRDTGNDVGFDTGPRDTGNDTGNDTGPRDVGNDVQAPSDPVVYTGTFPNRGGRFTANLTVLGERRSMVLAVPSNAVPNPPLLILYHGTNGDGSVIMDESNAAALANAEGVVVVAPTSRWLPFGDFDHPDAETYWETAPNTNADQNQDLVLTRAIIVEARRAYGVDPARVYMAGHSNGAFMAHFAAQLFRDRVAAYATSSGGIVNCARTTTCRFQASGTTCAQLRTRTGFCTCAGADLPVPVATTGNRPAAYIAHGTRDPLVSVYYSCMLEDRLQAAGATFQTVLRTDDGHVVPTNFAQSAYAFLRNRRLGMP